MRLIKAGSQVEIRWKTGNKMLKGIGIIVGFTLSEADNNSDSFQHFIVNFTYKTASIRAFPTK